MPSPLPQKNQSYPPDHIEIPPPTHYPRTHLRDHPKSPKISTQKSFKNNITRAHSH